MISLFAFSFITRPLEPDEPAPCIQSTELYPNTFTRLSSSLDNGSTLSLFSSSTAPSVMTCAAICCPSFAPKATASLSVIGGHSILSSCICQKYAVDVPMHIATISPTISTSEMPFHISDLIFIFIFISFFEFQACGCRKKRQPHSVSFFFHPLCISVVYVTLIPVSNTEPFGLSKKV